MIREGSKVAFDYVLTVEGKVVDSSEGRGPLNYTHGDGTLISGLTRQMEGLGAGAEKEIEVAPEEAYGVHDPEGMREVPISMLPQDLKPEVGMSLQGRSQEGDIISARISEVKGEIGRAHV